MTRDLHRRTALSSLPAALLLLLLAQPGAALATPDSAGPAGKRRSAAPGKVTPPPEPLHVTVARNASRALGLPVTIDSLIYNLFSSTFEGKGIAVGRTGAPRGRLKRLDVKMAWFSGSAGGKVSRVEARGASLTLPVAWLHKRLAFRLYRTLTVGQALLRGATVTFVEGGKRQLRLRGLSLEARGLRLPASGKLTSAGGRFTLRAAALDLGRLTLTDLVLSGRLAAGVLHLERLEAKLFGGTLSAEGTVSLAKNRLGKVALSGTLAGITPAGLSPGQALAGRFTLAGPSPQKLTLAGALSGPRNPRATRGKDPTAPAVRLKLKVGGRRLSGSSKAWRLR